MSPPSQSEIRIIENEKDILLLKEQVKEINKTMGKKMDDMKLELKSLNNKIVGGMGVIIIFLLGIIFQKWGVQNEK